MSMTAEYHAREWAKGKTTEQLRARIAQLEAMPRVPGVEFDDARFNHMRRVEIETLEAIVADGRPLAADGTPLVVGARVVISDEPPHNYHGTVIAIRADGRVWVEEDDMDEAYLEHPMDIYHEP